MSTAPNASREYLKSAVMTASPEQLQLMLIDGAIRFINQGKAAIERGDIEARFEALSRAQQIVLQMHAGLNRDANVEIVEQMWSLYVFIYNRLIEANQTSSIQAANDALRVLTDHRQTWVVIIEKVNAVRGENLAAAESTPTADDLPKQQSSGFEPDTDDDRPSLNLEG